MGPCPPTARERATEHVVLGALRQNPSRWHALAVTRDDTAARNIVVDKNQNHIQFSQ